MLTPFHLSPLLAVFPASVQPFSTLHSGIVRIFLRIDDPVGYSNYQVARISRFTPFFFSNLAERRREGEGMGAGDVGKGISPRVPPTGSRAGEDPVMYVMKLGLCT